MRPIGRIGLILAEPALSQNAGENLGAPRRTTPGLFPVEHRPIRKRYAEGIRIYCAPTADDRETWMAHDAAYRVRRPLIRRAEFAEKPDVALVAVTHNLASQVFYDDEQTYNLATGLTIRAEPYTDRVDLRSADESPAAKSLSKQAKGRAGDSGGSDSREYVWAWVNCLHA